MQKILHICQSDIGGTTEYIYLLIKNLDKSKYENILVCPSSGNIKRKISELGIKIYILEMMREISFIKEFKDILEIRKIIKKENPDILFLHSSKAGALGRIAGIGIRNLKVLYNSHGWSFTMDCSERKKKIYALIERILSFFTHRIINISEDEYKKAIERKIPKEKMIIIENGIDIKKYKENSKIKFLNKFVIGFVGRLSEQKNPMFLIKICEELIRRKEKEFIFYIVGDGELKDKFEKEIKDKKLEGYFFIRGWSEKVEKEIRNFDIALMISKWEGFGLVVCEYMAALKPVIAVNVGGVKNIIKNEINGVLVNKYSSEKFVDEILRIKIDKLLKEKLIKNAYKDVKEKYSIEKEIKEIEKIIWFESKKGI